MILSFEFLSIFVCSAVLFYAFLKFFQLDKKKQDSLWQSTVDQLQLFSGNVSVLKIARHSAPAANASNANDGLAVLITFSKTNAKQLFDALQEVFRRRSPITTLSLDTASDVHLAQLSSAWLSDVCDNDALESLSLSGLAVGQVLPLMPLCTALVLNRPRHLTFLFLRSVGLSAASFAALATALRANQTVTSLDLSNVANTQRLLKEVQRQQQLSNEMCENGAAAIAGMLATNTTLLSLSLPLRPTYNNARTVAKIIASGLKANHSLKTLDMSKGGMKRVRSFLKQQTIYHETLFDIKQTFSTMMETQYSLHRLRLPLGGTIVQCNLSCDADRLDLQPVATLRRNAKLCMDPSHSVVSSADTSDRDIALYAKRNRHLPRLFEICNAIAPLKLAPYVAMDILRFLGEGDCMHLFSDRELLRMIDGCSKSLQYIHERRRNKEHG